MDIGMEMPKLRMASPKREAPVDRGKPKKAAIWLKMRASVDQLRMPRAREKLRAFGFLKPEQPLRN